MYEPPAHLMPHSSEVQWSPEERLEQQPRHWSMVLDEEYVQCPGCKSTLYERKIPSHAAKCKPLQEMAQ